MGLTQELLPLGNWREEQKVAWIKWENCCKQKKEEKGGLRIKNLEKFNMALLGKWMWRAMNDHNGLWTRLLDAKYGRKEDWLKMKNGGKGSIW